MICSPFFLTVEIDSCDSWWIRTCNERPRLCRFISIPRWEWREVLKHSPCNFFALSIELRLEFVLQLSSSEQMPVCSKMLLNSNLSCHCKVEEYCCLSLSKCDALQDLFNITKKFVSEIKLESELLQDPTAAMMMLGCSWQQFTSIIMNKAILIFSLHLSPECVLCMKQKSWR